MFLNFKPKFGKKMWWEVFSITFIIFFLNFILIIFLLVDRVVYKSTKLTESYQVNLTRFKFDNIGKKNNKKSKENGPN
jgi:hypothetical protein